MINELHLPQSFLVLLRVALYICFQKGLPVQFVVEQRYHDQARRKGGQRQTKQSGSVPSRG